MRTPDGDPLLRDDRVQDPVLILRRRLTFGKPYKLVNESLRVVLIRNQVFRRLTR